MRGISAMPLRFAVTLILVVAGLAEAAAAERHYLVYLSSSTSCPFPAGITNPATFQPAPGYRPLLPPTTFALNQTVTGQLCFYDWSPTPTTTAAAQVCQPAPTVKGDEVCEQLLQFTAVGFRIQSFQAAPGFQANATNSSLKVIGGNVAGQVQTSVGTITLLATTAGGTFRLQTGDYIEADAAKRLVSNVVIAQTANSCGNRVINLPEECDDGNLSSADGCFRTCEFERVVRFDGMPSGSGAVTGSLMGVQKTIPTAGLSTTSDIANAFANVFNADPSLIAQAVEVDPVSNKIASDGVFGTFVSSDGGVTPVPEPARPLGLAAGALLLAAIGRRRARAVERTRCE
jgi:cysteine-rich repeat protein